MATVFPLWPGNVGLVQAAVALPLLSYGGTALIVNCVQLGLLQNVALRRQEY